MGVQDGETAARTALWGSVDACGPDALRGDPLLDYVRGRPSSVRRLVVPAELHAALVTWKPVLAEVPGLMALAQILLFPTRSNDNGVVVDYRTVYRAFGLKEARAQKDHVYTGPLLELYRDLVDPSLGVYSHDSERGLARTAAETGFPATVVDLVRRTVRGELEGADHVDLVTGAASKRRNAQAAVHRQRLSDVMGHEPEVEPPESARTISRYLNEMLDQQVFCNGRYGVCTKLGEAVAHVGSGARPFDDAVRAEGELLKLYWMGQYPMPLYVPCDRSPRLRADPYNQLMNLSGSLRPLLYTVRDVELDLDKAHLAALVVVARSHGIPTPVLDRYLAGDSSPDVWDELANTFNVRDMPDEGARRKAAKIAYAAVFGASEGTVIREVLERYVELTGDDGPDLYSVADLTGHELMVELFTVRDLVLDLIGHQGGHLDAEGRWIALGDFVSRPERKRGRTLLAYVCASYEQVLVAEAFWEATAELERAALRGPDSRPGFKIWMYQADGFTVRVGPKHEIGPVIERLQRAVARKAAELGMPTQLSVSYRAECTSVPKGRRRAKPDRTSDRAAEVRQRLPERGGARWA